MLSIDKLQEELANYERLIWIAYEERMVLAELAREGIQVEAEREYCRDNISYLTERCERVEFLLERAYRLLEEEEKEYFSLGDDIVAPRKIGMDRKELRTIRHFYCKGTQRKLKNTKKRLLNRSHRYALKRAVKTLNGRHTTRYRVEAWT